MRLFLKLFYNSVLFRIFLFPVLPVAILAGDIWSIFYLWAEYEWFGALAWICLQIALIVVLGAIVVYLEHLITAIVLSGAGRMQTGNDLDKGIEEVLDNAKIPNIFQFYWRMFRG